MPLIKKFLCWWSWNIDRVMRMRVSLESSIKDLKRVDETRTPIKRVTGVNEDFLRGWRGGKSERRRGGLF
jgi:hypothetical protein